MGFQPSGVKEFTKLDDTPASFGGQGGKVAQVNVGEDALEFAAKKLTYTQIYNGGVPSSGNLTYLGSSPYRFSEGSTGQRQMIWVVYNGDIYIGGGDGNGNGAQSKQFWKYNIATKLWTRLADLPFICAFLSRPAYYNGDIYAAAYCAAAGGDRLFVYTIATDSWATHAGVPAAYLTNGCFICPTVAWLIIVTTGATQNVYELGYGALGVWNAKAAVGSVMTAQVIADEVYIIDSNVNMRRYDEPTETLVNTGVARPANCRATRMYCEDENAIWIIHHPGGNPQSWQRSTGALAFVEQLTFPDGDDCIEGGYGVLPSGETDWHVLFGVISAPSILPNSCHGLVEAGGVWELASQAFIQGDDLIIDAKGVPVHCSVGGELRWIVTTYLAMVTIAGETWDFTLSKDYDYSGVDIWRGT